MAIIRSGTFTLSGYEFISATGLWTEIPTGAPGRYRWNWVSGSVLSTLVLSGPTILDTTLDGTGLAPGAPPPGFTPTWAAAAAGITVSNAPGFGMPFRTRMAGVSSQWGSSGGSANPQPPVPPFLLYLSLISAITDYEIDSAGLAFGDVVVDPATVLVQGDYDIIGYWWTIPALSACGDAQTPRLQLADVDPGAPWQALDPLDPDAAPTPTIASVTPNHGPLAGGTAITIDGSGFGDGCTVTIDGVPATSVVVVSQHRITCLAPAHAAGATTVVVTNPDGVTS